MWPQPPPRQGPPQAQGPCTLVVGTRAVDTLQVEAVDKRAAADRPVVVDRLAVVDRLLVVVDRLLVVEHILLGTRSLVADNRTLSQISISFAQDRKSVV